MLSQQAHVIAAAMEPRYQRALAAKLQEHANAYSLSDVSFK